MVRQLFVYLSIVSLVNIGGISAENFKVPVSPCEGGTTGQLTEVRISNCASLPCILRKQSTVTIEMDYIPGTSTNRVTTGAYGRLGAVPLPFVGTNGTPACGKIVSSKTRQAVSGCAQNAGESYTYTNSFRILAIYPSTNVNVQWELIDGATNQKIACFTLPAKIA